MSFGPKSLDLGPNISSWQNDPTKGSQQSINEYSKSVAWLEWWRRQGEKDSPYADTRLALCAPAVGTLRYEVVQHSFPVLLPSMVWSSASGHFYSSSGGANFPKPPPGSTTLRCQKKCIHFCQLKVVTVADLALSPPPSLSSCQGDCSRFASAPALSSFWGDHRRLGSKLLIPLIDSQCFSLGLLTTDPQRYFVGFITIKP